MRMSTCRLYRLCARAERLATVRAVVALMTAVAAGAQDMSSPPSTPTSVYYTMSVIALSKISAVESSFFTDFYVAYLWQDDRLAGSSSSDFDPSSNFSPVPEFVNALDDFSIDLDFTILNGSAIPAWPEFPFPPPVTSTWVLATGRKQRQFAAVLQLEEFPFDSQTAQVVMESKLWTSSEMQWVQAPVVRNAFAGVSVDGWDTTGTESIVTNFTYTALDQTYSRFIFNVKLKRQSVYYMTRIVTNVILLVLMACGVSFINALEADRLGFVQACFLGVVSWLFIIVSDTPRVGYLTRLDGFVNASFGAIFAMFFYNAVHAGYFKTIDKLSGYKSGQDGEMGSFVNDVEGDDGVGGNASPSVAVRNPIRLGTTAASETAPESSGSEHPAGRVVTAKRASILESAPIVGMVFETPPAEAGPDMSKRGRRKQCRSLPCSYRGEWRRWNPHRRLDMIFTTAVLACYFVAIAATLGRPTTTS